MVFGQPYENILDINASNFITIGGFRISTLPHALLAGVGVSLVSSVVSY